MINITYLLSIDVLGFGDFVRENPTKVVFDHYAWLVTGAAFSGEIIAAGEVDVMVYSDTIAIKSNNSNQSLCLRWLIQVAQLIQVGQYARARSEDALFLPVRGTITFGEFIFHKGDIWTQALNRPKIFASNIDMILGKPIIEAYQFEKNMDLMCIAVGDSAQQQIGHEEIMQCVNSNMLIQYNIPLKNGGTKNGILVNPVSTPDYHIDIKKLEVERQKHIGSPGIVSKYNNTLDLFDYVYRNKLFFPRVPG